jgi:hypothetical protein
MICTDDGGYAIVGTTSSNESDSVWLVKTDSEGNQLWNKTYGNAVDGATAYSLIQTTDGGYAFAGKIRYNATVMGERDFLLIKTDSFGNQLWTKTYNLGLDDRIYSVIQTIDGGYAFAACTNPGGNRNDFLLIKTDADGNQLWYKTYNSLGYAYSLVQANDGGYAIAGVKGYGPSSPVAYMVKTDSWGNVVWDKNFSTSGVSAVYSIIQTSDGGYALAGGLARPVIQPYYFWLIKVDSSGNELWNKTHYTLSSFAYSLIQTNDGGFALAGYANSNLIFGAGGDDFWLVKTDSSGNHCWNRTFGGVNSDIARSVIQTNDGAYVIAGTTSSFGAGQNDFWMVKIAGTAINPTPTPSPTPIETTSPSPSATPTPTSNPSQVPTITPTQTTTSDTSTNPTSTPSPTHTTPQTISPSTTTNPTPFPTETIVTPTPTVIQLSSQTTEGQYSLSTLLEIIAAIAIITTAGIVLIRKRTSGSFF